MKILATLIMFISAYSIASDSAWSYSKDLKAYMSPDLANHKLSAMLKFSKDGAMRFGIYLPYDQCYVSESYPEPFGTMYVLGGNEKFQLQCLAKGEAVIFPYNNAVSDGIVDALKHDGNVCLIVDDKTKLCFSGKGVNDLKA